MSAALSKDVKLLRLSLGCTEPEIEVTLRLPREREGTRVLAAEQSSGAVVIPAKQESPPPKRRRSSTCRAFR